MKIIKFVVGADSVVTCNGNRRAQKAGVQGDNKACTLEFDVSAVAKENAQYFIEFVLGNGTPLILSEESDGVRFADNVLSVVLDSAVSANGGNVEIRVVQVTVIDEMYKEVVEENTYSCFIYFESKSLAMVREKLRAYGVFLELKEYAKNLQGDANNKYNEANSKLSSAILAYADAMNALAQGVAINDEYFSFENGLLRLSQEYLAKISAQFEEKQFAFGLNPEEALEFVEGENRKNVLRIKSSGEIYQDRDGLHVDTGAGLKKDNDGRICADYTEHNVDEGSHNDIRVVIQGLSDRINALHDCDDTTLDQTKEIVAYIKANRSVIESVTTSKVNVADIIDNLTTNVSNKPLSARQGVELKKLVDAIVIPTSLSEFNNDTGFVDDDYVDGAVESMNLPRDVRVTDYDSNRVTVAFETGTGSSHDCVYDVDLTVDGKYVVYLNKCVDDGAYHYELAQNGDEPVSSKGRVYAFTYKVTNGELHYLAVGNLVVLNKVTLITSAEVTEDETAIVSFTEIQGYKKLHFIAEVPNADTTSAVSGFIRLASGTLVNGYVAGVIATSTSTGYKYYHLHIQKENGVWGGYFGASEKANQDATEQVKTIISKNAYELDTHKGEIKSFELKTQTSGVYFPIGTVVKMLGVEE